MYISTNCKEIYSLPSDGIQRRVSSSIAAPFHQPAAPLHRRPENLSEPRFPWKDSATRLPTNNTIVRSCLRHWVKLIFEGKSSYSMASSKFATNIDKPSFLVRWKSINESYANKKFQIPRRTNIRNSKALMNLLFLMKHFSISVG